MLAGCIGHGTHQHIVYPHGGLRVEEEVFRGVRLRHLGGAIVWLHGADEGDFGYSIAKVGGDEKFGRSAVIACCAHPLAIDIDNPLGGAALGVEKHIPIAPRNGQFHLVVALHAGDSLLALHSHSIHKPILQRHIVTLGRAVALFGQVACGVGDELCAARCHILVVKLGGLSLGHLCPQVECRHHQHKGADKNFSHNLKLNFFALLFRVNYSSVLHRGLCSTGHTAPSALSMVRSVHSPTHRSGSTFYSSIFSSFTVKWRRMGASSTMR